MEEAKQFYSAGLGDRLIKESYYPKEILEYLDGENKLVLEFLGDFETLIEVGCMNGRYLDLAIENKKKYIGVDVVSRYINEANKIIMQKKLSAKDFLALELSAEKLEVLFMSREVVDPVLIFPFNCFGNMKNFEEVVRVLAKLEKPFVIFSYSSDEQSDTVRDKYYKNCGYKDVTMIKNEQGHRFVSPEGLNTIAYNEVFLINLFKSKGVELSSGNFSGFGVYYSNFLLPKI